MVQYVGQLADEGMSLAAAGDASEANLAVLDNQLQSAEPLTESELQGSLQVETGQLADTDALVMQLKGVLQR